MGTYNLYHLKQKIIKDSIALTRSKNIFVVRSMCLLVGSCYYLGLLAVWHIPSLSIQMSYNLYQASMQATINYLNPPNQTFERLIQDPNLVRKTLQQIDNS
ncbi:hypothetical protein PPERSA_11883 [Pseudocohnilembus persalinus]|uniref:Uncharacterized protein n=1 Tax=Pseudocohnilembus persalinus TaxID=266149 RepID=A0A0V0QJT9_PSEPJ|nr:hypothetical protein PPERSA_11883 [Pseudocohnilembus persalinus]|eukprot:KRX02543.1 hypothetical protein PPERSA_11883 [Pseudocohnilembus persalinus]